MSYSLYKCDAYLKMPNNTDKIDRNLINCLVGGNFFDKLISNEALHEHFLERE